jgi:DNA-binding NarL/FixJ family response regulator
MSEPTPIRVMIVDDHLLVRDGLKLLLSTFDDLAVVALAEDGGQAVDLCQQVQPDVVLMDIVMPGMDGPTATARIRAACPEVQVIALTSFLEEDMIQQALRQGPPVTCSRTRAPPSSPRPSGLPARVVRPLTRPPCRSWSSRRASHPRRGTT